MANTGYTVECPFYVSEKAKTITCEDTIRLYSSAEKKREFMEKHCIHGNDWESCPYAKSMRTAYDTCDSLRVMEHKANVRYKEVLKLISNVGKLQKRCNSLNEENNALKSKVVASERVLKMLSDELRNQREKEDKLAKEMMGIANIYEVRFAYLLSHSFVQELREDVLNAWSESYEYRILPIIENDKTVGWKCEVREYGNKTGTTSEEVSETSSSEGADTKAEERE